MENLRAIIEMMMRIYTSSITLMKLEIHGNKTQARTFDFGSLSYLRTRSPWSD
jgi:hypothetical protein